ncbi:uncharacterized protein B0J16DRAFT_151244 [Fusarium flagelliforme]|uniref:uncharacterized protein n=1 Tax=Fusarium flagelliforme TaxID=2675880 RepID=UPI001E8E2822|nr:uncharacterized protein B0J16DRAFT_151244 [Fusarium flagelliforme]KAH7182691.1 hypothetical protein B0J16DRAFT_151244 [Fusarium flagelliforme]
MEPEYSGLFMTTIIIVILARAGAVGHRLMKPNHCEQQICSHVEYYNLDIDLFYRLILGICGAVVIVWYRKSHIDSTRLHFILDVNFYLFRHLFIFARFYLFPVSTPKLCPRFAPS